MRRLLLVGMIAGIVLAFTVACGGGGLSMLKVGDNLDADEVQQGMVYVQDFIFEKDYFQSFVKTVNCSNIQLEGGSVKFNISDEPTAPYFLWVCYSPITKDSPATVICMNAGAWSVIAVFHYDTDSCLQLFGGTSGTQRKGW